MLKSQARLLALCSGLTIACFSGSFDGTLLAQDAVASNPATTQLTQQILKQKLIETCAENALPGIWAGRFSIKEQPAMVEATGIRKWDTPEQVDADDIVHLGSCTKAMTAVIIGQLCTEGKLRLSSTLGEIFHDTAAVTESSWSEVTIQQLLQHRSGVHANFAVYQVFDAKHPDSVVAARNELAEAIWKQKRPRSPGFVYSNIGFILLGHIAEKIDGKSWEEIIATRLFQPLGMTSEGFGPVGKPDGTPESADAIVGRCWGHSQSIDFFSAAKSILGGKSKPNFTPQQIDNSRCLGPAGRVHMNLRDWSKFVLPFAQEDGYRQLQISKEVWNEMLNPNQSSKPNESYAAGWVLFDRPRFNGQAFFHNGSNTTWYCYALALPGKHQCILVATNVFNDPAQKACNDVAEFINTFPAE
jgi:CubicO group peptidase (beta-lactamase class C family)